MTNSLKNLKEKAKEDLTFFFPKRNKVKGFYGDDKIFFVCQKPSTGHFPSPKDKLFYKLLAKYDFCNAHITDLVKTRGKAKSEISKEELDLNWNIFQKELEMIKPKLLVGVGNDAYLNLKKEIKSIKIIKIRHYTFRYASKKKIERRLE